MPGCPTREAMMASVGKSGCDAGRAMENAIDMPSSASLSSPDQIRHASF
jgi:hypothetical protein